MKKVLLICSAFIVMFAVTAACVGAAIYNAQMLDSGKLESSNKQIVFFDRASAPIQTSDSVKTTLANLPEHVKWAFICVEDKNFYNHHGISYGRIAKAMLKNLTSRHKEGASTISQQLIKNTHLTSDKTYTRKIREAALAIKLEKAYSKEQILEMYLDAVYFGNGITGIESASRYYFDKEPTKLTIRESAALAGMLRSPARFNPVTHPESFTDRTNLVLSLMYNQNRISREAYETARAEDLNVHAKRPKNDAGAYTAAAANQASQITGLSPEEMGLKKYKIYTFFDQDVQNTINGVMQNEDYQIKNMSEKIADNLIVAASPDGEINGFYTNNRLVYAAKRNFASALKPLAVYAPAIELGIVTPDTIIVDEPYTAGDFHPKNYDNKSHGEVTVRESLANSYNIPAVKVLEYTTIRKAVDVAKGFGLPLDDENLSLALGVTSDGINASQVLGGYCALANGGLSTFPSFISHIEDAGGQTVWEYTKPYIRAVSWDTCNAVTDMLHTAVKDGTARKMASLGFDIAAKTGTGGAERQQKHSAKRAGDTNTDAVNVSYTPSEVLLVWVGNADMKAENDLPANITGGGITTFIARDIMKEIGKNPSATSLLPTQQGKSPDSLHESPPLTKGEFTGFYPSFRITLTGKVGEIGAPVLTFNTEKDKKYEIYKRVDNTTSLIEVIKSKSKEDYTLTDKNAAMSKIIEYWVTCGDIKSNTVKIYAAGPIDKNAVTPKNGVKHWFF